MAKKIYQKRGNLNFKERKLIEQIEIDKTLQQIKIIDYEKKNNHFIICKVYFRYTAHKKTC